MDSKGLIILLATVTVLTAVVFTWHNNQISQSVPTIKVAHQEKSKGLGASIYENGSNPVGESIPETNAMSNVTANPFDTYTNPFENQ